MNLLKSILMGIHAQNKNRINELYLEKMGRDNEDISLVYHYLNLKFYFGGTGIRTPEKLVLYIEIPEELVYKKVNVKNSLVLEHYLLKYLTPDVNKINEEYFNKNKSSREKPYIESQKTNEVIVRRNGMTYNALKKVFIYKLYFVVPLINNVYVNSKSCFKAIKEIINVIDNKILTIDKKEFDIKINVYSQQLFIREYMKKYGYISFIGNGSILPRKEGTNKPLDNAVRFVSPKEMEVEIVIDDNTKLKGMGIKKGITVITGGGYSGKTTLLEAIEMGVYNHEIDDGREFCLTDNSAMKICAEDGRYIANTDISTFYKYIPYVDDITNFSTNDASGSVSQAVNIIEAVNMKSKVLLIDEDRSATNFMIRDYNMHMIVKNDPIIPFTNRIRQLYTEYDVSTILVIGGSSVYLNYADEVLLLENYLPNNITKMVKNLSLPKVVDEIEAINMLSERKLANLSQKDAFTYFQIVANDKSKNIVVDEYVADITFISTLLSDYQINYLAYIMQIIFLRKEFFEEDIITNIMKKHKMLYLEGLKDIIYQFNLKCDIWFEEVRCQDIISCLNRMRGIRFEKRKEE